MLMNIGDIKKSITCGIIINTITIIGIIINTKRTTNMATGMIISIR